MLCLNLVFNIWPSSVLPYSGIAKFDFCHVLPKSGLGKTDVLPKSVLPSSGAPPYAPSDWWLCPRGMGESPPHIAVAILYLKSCTVSKGSNFPKHDRSIFFQAC